MLAGADYVVMGAGIPMEIPGILDDLSEGKPCKLVIDCEGAPSDEQQESQLRAERFAAHRPRPLRHRPPPRAEARVRSSSRNLRHRSQAYPFSAEEFWGAAGKPELATQIQLKRPNFLPIVSSVLLAQASSAVLAADPDPCPGHSPIPAHQAMLKRARGKGPTKGIQGFVIELPTAGGHNAPPRGFRCRLPPRRRQAPRRLRCG